MCRTSANGTEEAPRPSQGEPPPASNQPATDGQQQASQPCPQAAEYGTDSTGGQPAEPDAGIVPPSILDRKTSLADFGSLSADLPPSGHRSYRIQIAERTQLPPLAAQRRTVPN